VDGGCISSGAESGCTGWFVSVDWDFVIALVRILQTCWGAVA
jgi:hypothetical protein